jgi:hypothetical protein
VRYLVHVERKTTDVADVWVEADEEMTHEALIERAAEQASDDGMWEIESFYISTGIGSYIKERAE